MKKSLLSTKKSAAVRQAHRRGAAGRNRMIGSSSSLFVVGDCGDEARAWRVTTWEVEDLLNYRFNNKKLLEAALTHQSYADAESYQRLEFVGDAALGLAISKDIFLDYPDVDQGQLTLLHSVIAAQKN
ncbi:hypothetical protein RJ639_006686 [Escallonia herrerae]|uniref:RNase III domain-containing protein n=1 Tax=Escallonia herrerae TaxID=1293975 RepID=A0AA88W049_9ASTE|nr:hypothetical protein RJ639_006686 [Escallonia herrerae]